MTMQKHGHQSASLPHTHTHTHTASSAVMMKWPCPPPSVMLTFAPHIYSNDSPSRCFSAILCLSEEEINSGCSSTLSEWTNRQSAPADVIPDINCACMWEYVSTLISPPQHRRPGNPSSAPVYGSSGSAPLPAACASCFFLSLGERKKENEKQSHKQMNKWMARGTSRLNWNLNILLPLMKYKCRLRTFGYWQLTWTNWPYSKVSWLLNTESHHKQTLNSPLMYYL